MKINKHNIKAFTLSELIVVLILTTIVVGLAFSVLSLVQKQMSAIKLNYQKSTELNKLETSLWLDFNRYSKISYDDLNNELIFKNEIDSTRYKFNQTFIIRKTDTFKVSVEDKQFYFNGDVFTSKKIDAFKIKTSKVHQNKELFVFKNNDATEYIE